MVRACILIRVQAGKSGEVLASLRRFPEIKKSFAVFGRYDVVSFADVVNYEAVSGLSSKVNGLLGVRSTETLIEG